MPGGQEGDPGLAVEEPESTMWNTSQGAALWPEKSLKGAHWLLLDAMRQKSN